MGKIKRERTKYHTIAVKRDDDPNVEKKPTLAFKPQLNSMQNIFAGINIQLSDINKIDENLKSNEVKKEPIRNEEMSAETNMETTSKSMNTKREFNHLEQKPITKKEKMALKHKTLMEKLDATHKATAELKKRKQKQKQKNNCDNQVLLKSQEDICPMLTPAATKSSTQNANQPAAKNVFSIPSFRDDLPALNSVFESRKDILSVQTKSTISKKKNTKKDFGKNYNFLKKSMVKKMK